MQKSSSRRWLAALCVVAVVGVYLALAWPALGGPFVFDDLPNLAALAKGSPIHTWAGIADYLSSARSFPGRPLAMLSFLAQQSAWPDNPFPFKLVNLLLHVANAGLLYLLGFPLLRYIRPDWTALTTQVMASTVALAWLVHPMHLSTIMLVVQRMTLMASFFVLLGLLAYVHGLTSEHFSTAKRGLWMAGGIIVAGTLAVLSKESGALLPIYALAIDATLLRGRVLTLPRGLRVLRRLLIYPAVAMIVGLLLMLMHDPFSLIPGRDFSIFQRLLTEPRVLLDYATKIVIPNYASFGLYHDDFALSLGAFSPWTTLPAIGLVVAGIIAAFVTRRRWPLLAFALCWFLGGHVMESGPVALELYFEHRNYLPMFGPLFAVAVAIASLRPGAFKRMLGLLASIWLVACLFATALYANVWSSQEKLSYFWADAHPASVRARGDYAAYLFEKGMLEGSTQILTELQTRQPNELGVDMNLLYIGCFMGAITPERVDALKSKIATASWSRLGFEGLGQVRELVSSGRCGKTLDDRAWLGLSDAMIANPAFASEPIAMGRLHYQRHELARAQGNLSLAIRELDETARFENDPEIARLQASYLADAGLFDNALETLRRPVQNRPPLLRRLLVDDAALNRAMARQIQARKAQATKPSKPTTPTR
jgi:protein O-mannosyl-transferase